MGQVLIWRAWAELRIGTEIKGANHGLKEFWDAPIDVQQFVYETLGRTGARLWSRPVAMSIAILRGGSNGTLVPLKTSWSACITLSGIDCPTLLPTRHRRPSLAAGRSSPPGFSFSH